MISVVSRWRVYVEFDGVPPITLYMYKQQMGNVLREFADIYFDWTPQSITVSADPLARPTSGNTGSVSIQHSINA